MNKAVGGVSSGSNKVSILTVGELYGRMVEWTVRNKVYAEITRRYAASVVGEEKKEVEKLERRFKENKRCGKEVLREQGLVWEKEDVAMGVLLMNPSSLIGAMTDLMVVSWVMFGVMEYFGVEFLEELIGEWVTVEEVLPGVVYVILEWVRREVMEWRLNREIRGRSEGVFFLEMSKWDKLESDAEKKAWLEARNRELNEEGVKKLVKEIWVSHEIAKKEEGKLDRKDEYGWFMLMEYRRWMTGAAIKVLNSNQITEKMTMKGSDLDGEVENVLERLREEGYYIRSYWDSVVWKRMIWGVCKLIMCVVVGEVVVIGSAEAWSAGLWFFRRLVIDLMIVGMGQVLYEMVKWKGNMGIDLRGKSGE